MKSIYTVLKGVCITVWCAFRPHKDISHKELIDHDYNRRSLRYHHPDVEYTETPEEYRERRHKMYTIKQKHMFRKKIKKILGIKEKTREEKWWDESCANSVFGE